MQDLAVQFYFLGSGLAPSGEATWADDGEVITFIGTGFSYDPKQDAALVHGHGSNQPTGTRKGAISYEWSFDALYTNDAYTVAAATTKKLSEFVEDEVGFFAMRIDLGDSIKVFEYCSVTGTPMKVGEGEALTISLSGVAEVLTTEA
jgi:hypothetical protein